MARLAAAAAVLERPVAVPPVRLRQRDDMIRFGAELSALHTGGIAGQHHQTPPLMSGVVATLGRRSPPAFTGPRVLLAAAAADELRTARRGTGMQRRRWH